MNFVLDAIIVILCLFMQNDAFAINFLFDNFLNKLDKSYDYGKVSESFTHEEIIKRGTIRTVVKYFYDQMNDGSKIDISKKDTDYYYNLVNLYNDYYGMNYDQIDLNNTIEIYLKPNVAIVDQDPATSNLPYAHFDAEEMYKSNERVMNLTNKVYELINAKDYISALNVSAQALHTIQDFYAHSNWVEMGHENDINVLIGTENFRTLKVTDFSDNNTCVSNCSVIEIPCTDPIYSVMEKLFLMVGVDPSVIKCPIRYYNCFGNILVPDKLLSGYYGGQRFEDGSPAAKPLNSNKCSHGGIFDVSTEIPAIGGINKDCGYFLFSPHADLHLKASDLAIKHTEYFLNQIRSNIGDDEFGKLLLLKPLNDSCSSIR